MKIYQLLEQLISKFVPLDDVTKSDLHLESVQVYNKLKDERQGIIEQNKDAVAYNEDAKDEVGFEPKKLRSLSLKHKFIGLLEAWYMRYLFALLFIYLVPKIKNYITGEPKAVGKGHDDDDFEDDDEDSEYQDYLRMKYGNR